VQNVKSIHNFVRKQKRKKPLVGFKHRWKNNNEMNLREMGHENIEWTEMVQIRI
jgi:hypothetical protein